MTAKLKREFTERDLIDIVVQGTASLVKEDESKLVYWSGIKENGESQDVNSIAIQIGKAFQQIQGKNVSVLAHNKCNLCDESCIRCDGKCIHIVSAGDGRNRPNSEKVKEFMNEEIGWAAIENVKVFKDVAEVKLKRKFNGNWRVIVFDTFTNFSVQGVLWKKNDLRIFCLHSH